MNHKCCYCGRFIGSGGRIDIVYDDYSGGYEEGYSKCERCLEQERNDEHRNQPILSQPTPEGRVSQ